MKDKRDFLDKLKRIRRGPAVLMQKDVGVILANTSIDKESRVLDAGSGSGVLTANLARFVKKVYSYDNRKEFLEIAKENCKRLGLDNITFKNKDVYSEIKEKNLDLVTLDLSEPWRALKNAHNALKENGYCVCFTPHITQVSKILEASEGLFKIIKTVEDIEREWIVEKLRLRPESKMIGHTAFITVLRKI